MNTTLTLAEYQAQTEPVKMPIVKLQESEYTVLEKYIKNDGTKEGEKRAVIKINAYPDRSYEQRGSSLRLFVIGYEGTGTGESCFWLPKTENENIRPAWLFIGTFPTCYVYCDKSKEINRDFKTILRLFYSPLHIEITEANKKAYPQIVAIALEELQKLKERVNEPLEVSASGQTTGLSISSGPDVVIVK